MADGSNTTLALPKLRPLNSIAGIYVALKDGDNSDLVTDERFIAWGPGAASSHYTVGTPGIDATTLIVTMAVDSDDLIYLEFTQSTDMDFGVFTPMGQASTDLAGHYLEVSPYFIVGPRGLTGPAGADGQTGATGATGPAGAAGQGVPTGGADKQVLAKASGTDYDTEWVNAPTLIVVENSAVTYSGAAVSIAASEEEAINEIYAFQWRDPVTSITETDEITISVNGSTPTRARVISGDGGLRFWQHGDITRYSYYGIIRVPGVWQLVFATADRGRLLPADATNNQIARYNATAEVWNAVDLPEGRDGADGAPGHSPVFSAGSAFPASPTTNDFHLFSVDVASGLDWLDADGATDLTAASAGDVARYTGSDWQRAANIRGAQGAMGATGQTGAAGAAGADGAPGADGAVPTAPLAQTATPRSLAPARPSRLARPPTISTCSPPMSPTA